MRYERVGDIVKLAIRLQGMGGGLTIDDIMDEFRISRRTAERMRDAVEGVFGALEEGEKSERLRRWRFQSPTVGQLVRVSAEELAELESAAAGLDRAGLMELAASLRNLRVKLQAISRARSSDERESALEMLMRTEGLAMRAGPRPRLEEGLLSVLREAIKFSRVVEFEYLAQGT